MDSYRVCRRSHNHGAVTAPTTHTHTHTCTHTHTHAHTHTHSHINGPTACAEDPTITAGSLHHAYSDCLFRRMYVYIYIYIYIYICTKIFSHTHTHTHTHTYLHFCTQRCLPRVPKTPQSRRGHCTTRTWAVSCLRALSRCFQGECASHLNVCTYVYMHTHVCEYVRMHARTT